MMGEGPMAREGAEQRHVRFTGKNCLVASVFFAAIFLVLSILLSPEAPEAFAEEPGNYVNPHQLPDSSFIYDTSIIDLTTADAYYNGQTVQVVGEAVGDSIKVDLDNAHRWITLISGADPKTNATIVVYMTEEAASSIDTFGKYGATGTTLRARGTYHLACSEHDGISDIHAEYVAVVRAGSQNPDSFDSLSFVPGAIAIVIGLLMLALFYYIRERRR